MKRLAWFHGNGIEVPLLPREHWQYRFLNCNQGVLLAARS
jgi:hypothetical protein